MILFIIHKALSPFISYSIFEVHFKVFYCKIQLIHHMLKNNIFHYLLFLLYIQFVFLQILYRLEFDIFELEYILFNIINVESKSLDIIFPLDNSNGAPYIVIIFIV